MANFFWQPAFWIHFNIAIFVLHNPKHKTSLVTFGAEWNEKVRGHGQLPGTVLLWQSWTHRPLLCWHSLPAILRNLTVHNSVRWTLSHWLNLAELQRQQGCDFLFGSFMSKVPSAALETWEFGINICSHYQASISSAVIKGLSFVQWARKIKSLVSYHLVGRQTTSNLTSYNRIKPYACWGVGLLDFRQEHNV